MIFADMIAGLQGFLMIHIRLQKLHVDCSDDDKKQTFTAFDSLKEQALSTFHHRTGSSQLYYQLSHAKTQ